MQMKTTVIGDITDTLNCGIHNNADYRDVLVHPNDKKFYYYVFFSSYFTKVKHILFEINSRYTFSRNIKRKFNYSLLTSP